MSLQVRELTIDWPGFSQRWSFELLGADRAAVMGPSGSGKTTLLRALVGLPVGPSGQVHGSIRLKGRELLGLPPEVRGIGMVFQDPLLFPSMTVLENVTFGLRFRGVPLKEREKKGLAALERVGLAVRARDSTRGLSGGEKQRLSFLRAVLPEPDLLLLDEPFSALDLAMRERLQSDLLEWHQGAQVPVILVTHDEREAATLTTRPLRAEPRV